MWARYVRTTYENKQLLGVAHVKLRFIQSKACPNIDLRASCFPAENWKCLREKSTSSRRFSSRGIVN